ncbi:hypothetical protein TIFTF001_011845 [Ficus carica]|uniref:Cytochrome P450 n=1 Tax=Ficus carica TaxID=3494 RepID=A0AA87ZXY0_FICCA|nr:hypothetical protein TIFTF001_011845 [Ficus carica]
MFGHFTTTLFALLLGLITFAYFVLKKLFVKQEPQYGHNLPNGNMGWLPFLGETLAFLKPHSSNSLGSFLQNRCFWYGKVFKSHLFGSPAIVSCDLELNMFILQNEDKLFQTSYPKAIHGILGKNSLLLVSGDLHKKLRNVIVSFISSSKSKSNFLHCVEKLLNSMFESWNHRKEVAFFKEAKTFTLSLMVKHLLNIEPGEPQASQILEDFETYMKGFVSLPIYIPGTSYFKAVKARERLASKVREIMKERVVLKGKVGAGFSDIDGDQIEEEEEEDFLDVILEKKNLSEEEKMSIVLDILLGGYETTATLMALIVYFIGHAPDVFQKLKEEHQSIRESKKEKEPLNWEDYKKMEFTYHRFSSPQDGKFFQSSPVYILMNLFMGNPTNLTLGDGPWKIKADDLPLAYPYVEFRRGLMLEIEPANKDHHANVS